VEAPATAEVKLLAAADAAVLAAVLPDAADPAAFCAAPMAICCANLYIKKSKAC